MEGLAMRVLITGGAGFIGSHLAEELLQRGDEVTVIDDLSTGLIRNIEHLERQPRFHCIIHSVKDERTTENLVRNCDQIYHLAAAVGVKLIVQQPTQTIETNISGTEIVLRLACRYRKKVLVASTSEVYGKSSKSVFGEDDDLVIGGPKKYRWAYAASKAVDEFLAASYWHEKRLPVVVVRLFNTVGPRQRGQYGMVIPRFVDQASLGKPITVYGNGKQTRCFLYVKDCVCGLIALMNCQGAIGEVVNIGNPKEFSINEVAELVRKKLNSSSVIRHVPYHKAYKKGFEDMARRVPNIDKANELIGFQPSVQLSEILDRVIEYYSKYGAN